MDTAAITDVVQAAAAAILLVGLAVLLAHSFGVVVYRWIRNAL